MKKVFLTLAVVMMAMAANAQVWMGGSFGFNSSKANENAKPVLTYSIAPEVGYTIAPRWDVAVGLSYAGEKSTATLPIIGDVVAKESTIGVTPYVRYTAFDLGKVGFFIDACFDYSQTFGTLNGESTGKTQAIYAGLRPGVKFAASDKITFAARIGSFGYSKVIDGASNFGINVNNSAFTLGLWWAF